MPLPKKDLLKMIQDALPDAEVEITSLVADNDHYQAIVRSKTFAGKSKIAQHQMVYAALGGKMGGELHALSLKTEIIPE
jgi:stress-induced morphogen